VVAPARYGRRCARHRAVNAAQPLVVVTNWGARGGVVLGLLFVAVAAAGIVYWRMLARAHFLSPVGLLAIVGLLLAAAWCVPVLFSSDVYAYAAYGELARVGLNPYAHVVLARGDALIRDAAWQWNGTLPICVYGPAFVALARTVVTALAPLGTLAQLAGIRAMASAAFLICVPLAYAAFSGDPRLRRRAAATIGLNPVAIWCAAEGHNDALALAIVLAGFALVQRRVAGIGAAVVALSSLVKPPGAAAAIGLAAVDRRARIGTAAGIAIAAAFSVPLFVGTVTQLVPQGRYAPQASLQAVLAPLGAIPAVLLAVAVAAALIARGVALLRRSRNDGWIALGLAAWVLVPNPYPWYALWLVGIAALSPLSRLGKVAILLSFTSLLRYVPDAIGTPSPAVSVALAILAMLPLLGLVPRRSWYNERLV
jgi:alpha-1,6-mannosyltransferase